MRIRSVCLFILSTAIAASSVTPAQQPAPQDPPAAESRDKKPATTRPVLLPEVSFQDLPFGEVIAFLREVDPTFQAVVSYEPGAQRGGPTIQDLRLKNVSTAAVLQLLAEAYPQIRIGEMQPDENTSVWTIRIEPDPRQDGGGLGEGGGGGLYGGSSDGGAPSRSVTTVRRLREIVDELAVAHPGETDHAAARKKALDSVVSLVQAVIDAQGDSAKGAAIKVHEATETLVFKGNREVAELVSETLHTISPSPEQQVRDAMTHVRKQEEANAKRRADLIRQIEQQQKQISELTAELAKLRGK